MEENDFTPPDLSVLWFNEPPKGNYRYSHMKKLQITWGTYVAMLIRQKGKCQACRRYPDDPRRPQSKIGGRASFMMELWHYPELPDKPPCLLCKVCYEMTNYISNTLLRQDIDRMYQFFKEAHPTDPLSVLLEHDPDYRND